MDLQQLIDEKHAFLIIGDEVGGMFDKAVIGYTEALQGTEVDIRLVYDYDLMVKAMVEEDNISEIEAVDYINFNIVRSIPYYTESPIIMYTE